MILITGMYNVENPAGGFLIQNIAADISHNGPAFTQMAIESVMPSVGNPFIAISLFFFSFTTLLAYYYIAESNVAYIRRSIKLPAAMFLLGDIGLGIMAWVNIIGILIIYFMAAPAMKALALKDYEAQKAAGVEKYTFDPKKLGIKNAHFWEK